MIDYIQIYWTCGGLDEARLIARHLLEKRLVACVNIIPSIESIFLWKGKIDTSQEVKVIFKTKEALFEKVKEFILQHANYELPEILKIPILGGSSEYLKWIDENTKV